ncbi:hypothetical protein DPEC_G00316100 [Dallia pectoralis]|uniref:Uncharacterized protein n=1 Tax=Dallia pectoralis TaxID=75939 RepID=A0ACC2FCL9_DALPE|nr:hypothetical protein DPEC_G00316100 [Dallia pectoralis]
MPSYSLSASWYTKPPQASTGFSSRHVSCYVVAIPGPDQAESINHHGTHMASELPGQDYWSLPTRPDSSHQPAQTPKRTAASGLSPLATTTLPDVVATRLDRTPPQWQDLVAQISTTPGKTEVLQHYLRTKPGVSGGFRRPVRIP